VGGIGSERDLVDGNPDRFAIPGGILERRLGGNQPAIGKADAVNGKAQNLRGPSARHYVALVDMVMPCQRRDHLVASGARIAVRIHEPLDDRLFRPGGKAQWVLVGAELDRIGRRAAPTPRVGDRVE